MSLVNITLTLYIHTQPYELLNLADALEKKQFSDRECIIKQARAHHTALTLTLTHTHTHSQGDRASAFYIVESGTARILKEDPVCHSVYISTFVKNCTRKTVESF